MLVQSHEGEIVLLPALPKAWASGNIKGLRARGGFEVDMTWKDGKLTQTGIRSKVQGPCTVRYGDKTVTLHMKEGESIKLDGGMRK